MQKEQCPCWQGLSRDFLQQRTAVHADPAGSHRGVRKPSTTWMQMPGWENGFVVAVLYNKPFKTCLLPLRVLVCRMLPKMQPGVKTDSHVYDAFNLITCFLKGRLLVKDFGLNMFARVKRQVLMSDI